MFLLDFGVECDVFFSLFIFKRDKIEVVGVVAICSVSVVALKLSLYYLDAVILQLNLITYFERILNFGRIYFKLIWFIYFKSVKID